MQPLISVQRHQQPWFWTHNTMLVEFIHSNTTEPDEFYCRVNLNIETFREVSTLVKDLPLDWSIFSFYKTCKYHRKAAEYRTDWCTRGQNTDRLEEEELVCTLNNPYCSFSFFFFSKLLDEASVTHPGSTVVISRWEEQLKETITYVNFEERIE